MKQMVQVLKQMVQVLALGLFFATPNMLIQVNAADFCEKSIQPSRNTPLAYRNRGDRCEGLFAKKVSSTGLRLVAFHKNPVEFKPGDKSLTIASSTTAKSHLIVTSLRRKQYYRMDTKYSGQSFKLPLGIISHPEVSINPSELAAKICIGDCNVARPVLVAASFQETTLSNPYVALKSDVEIFELRVKVSDFSSGETLFDDELLGDRTWAPGRIARFEVREYFQKHQKLNLTITARGRNVTQVDTVSVVLSP